MRAGRSRPVEAAGAHRGREGRPLRARDPLDLHGLSEALAGGSRVPDRDEVRVCAQRALGAQPEHLRAKRGQAPSRLRSDLERQVLELRLVHGLTQREISHRIGYSQMHVSRLLRRSMLSLNAGTALATAG